MNQLEKIRKEIDKCDEAIVKNFEKRIELVMEVLTYKRQEGLPIFQPDREREVIEKVSTNFSNNNFNDEIKELYKEIMRISRRIQSRTLFPYSISLIGFMGTGKTSITKDLAKKLDMPYIDVDMLIQEKTGMSIDEIFAKNGESYFRNLESDILRGLSHSTNMIVSCGGGAVLNEENVINLKRNSKVVLLKASPETILQRLQNDRTRPLLKGKMELSYIESMLKKRNAAYHKAADLIVNTDNKSFDEISEEIMKALLREYNS